MKTKPKKKSTKPHSTISFEEGLDTLSKEKPGFREAFESEYKKLERRKKQKQSSLK